MALSSSPTLTEVRAAMNANARYALNESVTEAGDYYEAITWLITNLPSRANKGQEGFEYSMPTLEKLRSECLGWIKAQSDFTDADLVYATRKGR